MPNAKRSFVVPGGPVVVTVILIPASLAFGSSLLNLSKEAAPMLLAYVVVILVVYTQFVNKSTPRWDDVDCDVDPSSNSPQSDCEDFVLSGAVHAAEICDEDDRKTQLQVFDQDNDLIFEDVTSTLTRRIDI